MNRLLFTMRVFSNNMLSIMTKEFVVNEVNRFRTDHRLTQEQLAASVGVSRQTIIAIEKGHYTPSVLLALQIARFFNQPLEKVFKTTHAK